jgi:LmbE family N-acetylglucosaminyl deacetylase
MRQVRNKEQKKAAVIGEYAALVLLDYPSQALKSTRRGPLLADLRLLLRAVRPKIVYTHNLADKHDTHVAVAMRVVEALRGLPAEVQPDDFFGCEVWRDLDWLLDQDKIPFDLSTRPSLQAALIGVFDSQVTGGKRYDLATLGRRRAHATYFQPHAVDEAQGLNYGMDLNPLVKDPNLGVAEYVLAYIQRFAKDVEERIRRFNFPESDSLLLE